MGEWDKFGFAAKYINTYVYFSGKFLTSDKYIIFYIASFYGYSTLHCLKGIVELIY